MYYYYSGCCEDDDDSGSSGAVRAVCISNGALGAVLYPWFSHDIAAAAVVRIRLEFTHSVSPSVPAIQPGV